MKTSVINGLLLTVFVTGCATIPYQPYAREVKKQPSFGGVIAMKQDYRPEDRARADSLMASNCGSKAVQVAEEGEVVTGTNTNSAAKKTNETENQSGIKFTNFTFGGAPENSEKTATNSTTTQLKEWQINYTCAPIVVEKTVLKALKRTAKK